MSNAKLLSLKLRRFKSYREPTTIHFSPLTVVLGRNNSGKSTIIQALLLLKQTLALPRPEVPLHLEGIVDALSLRELTYGWPKAGEGDIKGPTITVRWSSTINVRKALDLAHQPDRATLASHVNIEWITDHKISRRDVITTLELRYWEIGGRTVLKVAKVTSTDALDGSTLASFTLSRHEDGVYKVSWDGLTTKSTQVDWDHFLPYLLIDRRNVGPRARERSFHNAFLLLFAQPLDDLKSLLVGFSYLGSIRTPPPTLYRPATVAPDDIGVSGEYAAQMLHARRLDRVHYLEPLRIDTDGRIRLSLNVRARNLVDAVNDILTGLGIETPLQIEDIKDVGFKLLFGNASLQHVGRGLSYLLPVIQLGLVADPLRYSGTPSDQDLATYQNMCTSYAHCAFEEPESHLHPKVQSRLAHWLVSLAMGRRQALVETHSDHLVRRLRGLVARARPGSDLEKWLLSNVSIVSVSQQDGQSVLHQTHLTASGGVEDWPSEFMDEATDEERSIYDASLEKTTTRQSQFLFPMNVEHDPGKEPDVDE